MDDRSNPEVVPLDAVSPGKWTVDAMAKYQLYPRSVVMSKFHTAILMGAHNSERTTGDGNLWMAGVGSMGRLGMGDEATFLAPRPVGKYHVKAVALGQDHTVFITHDGDVYSFGSNEYGQLGYEVQIDSQKRFVQLEPRRVTALKKESMLGVAASRIHSVAFSETGVYTWGKNKGQLGYPEISSSPLFQPRKVSSITDSIVMCCASEEATTFLTGKGDVLMLHHFQCFKLTFPTAKHPDALVKRTRRFKVVKIGCTINDEFGALSSHGELFLWRMENGKPKFRRVVLPRLLIVTDFDMGIDGSLIIAAHESMSPVTMAFTCRKTKKRIFIAEVEERVYECTRVPFLVHVRKVFANSFGAFGILRSWPSPEMLFEESKIGRLEQKLSVINHEVLPISDMTIKVGDLKIPAHQIVMSSHSALLRRVLDGNSPDLPPGILYDSPSRSILFDESTFETSTVWSILDFAYRNKLPHYADEKTRNVSRILEMSELLLFFAKPFTYKPGSLSQLLCSVEFGTFSMGFDVELHLSDGELYAHRFILAVQSSYFTARFRQGTMWSDDPSQRRIVISLPNTSVQVMKLVLRYLYGHSLETLFEGVTFQTELGLVEFLALILIAADEMILEGLKLVCEFKLAVHLNLYNLFYLMDLSDRYQARRLEQCCMDFVLGTLDFLIETRWIFTFDTEIIKKIERAVKERQLACFPITRKGRRKDTIQAVNAFMEEFFNAFVLGGKNKTNHPPMLPSPGLQPPRSVEDMASPSIRTDDEDMFELELDQNSPKHTSMSLSEPPKSTPKKSKFVPLDQFQPEQSVSPVPVPAKTWNTPMRQQSQVSLQALIAEQARSLPSTDEHPKSPKIPFMPLVTSPAIKKQSQKERKMAQKAAALSNTAAAKSSPWTIPTKSSTTSTSSISVSVSPGHGLTKGVKAMSINSPSNAVFPSLGSSSLPTSSVLQVPNSNPLISGNISTVPVLSTSPSFMEIQAQQERERAYMSKLLKRKKSLAMIQDEERAIGELRVYYDSKRVTWSGEIVELSQEPI